MTDEILKDAELEQVSGGSGMEVMALMNSLQSEGLAKFKTPLIAGNEKAAAAELKTYLSRFANVNNGVKVGLNVNIDAGDRRNLYLVVGDPSGSAGGEYRYISADELIERIRSMQG